MKHLLTATSLSVLLVAGAGGAYAANAVTPETKTPAYAAPVVADADAMKAADQLKHTNIRQDLQDQLTKAGYTSIHIMPSSFYIQAKDKKGEPVAMVVGPDSFVEVTDMTAKTPASTAQAPAPMSSPTTQQK